MYGCDIRRHHSIQGPKIQQRVSSRVAGGGWQGHVIFCYVGVTIWTIAFARDYLLSSSRKQQDIAQHLNEFRQAPELTSKWSELWCVTCLNSSDSLLLQLMIGEIFENISSFRHESVVHMLKIREQYGGKTSGKPFLTPLQKDRVAYISG